MLMPWAPPSQAPTDPGLRKKAGKWVLPPISSTFTPLPWPPFVVIYLFSHVRLFVYSWVNLQTKKPASQRPIWSFLIRESPVWMEGLLKGEIKIDHIENNSVLCVNQTAPNSCLDRPLERRWQGTNERRCRGRRSCKRYSQKWGELWRPLKWWEENSGNLNSIAEDILLWVQNVPAMSIKKKEEHLEANGWCHLWAETLKSHC